MAPVLGTLKVICRLQAFSSAIHETFVQHFTRFQLTKCSHSLSATAGLLVPDVVLFDLQGGRAEGKQEAQLSLRDRASALSVEIW